MMEEEDHPKHEAYLEGRLEGLNQLVAILRDATEDKASPEANSILRSIVVHISDETKSIIDNMKEVHGEHPVIREATAATKKMAKEAAKVEQEQIEPAPVLKKHVVATDELMKRLMDLQKQASGDKPEESTK